MTGKKGQFAKVYVRWKPRWVGKAKFGGIPKVGLGQGRGRLCSRSPCINKFRIAPFLYRIYNTLFHKISYLTEEVNCTEPTPSFSIPWLGYLIIYENQKTLVNLNFNFRTNVVASKCPDMEILGL